MLKLTTAAAALALVTIAPAQSQTLTQALSAADRVPFEDTGTIGGAGAGLFLFRSTDGVTFRAVAALPAAQLERLETCRIPDAPCEATAAGYTRTDGARIDLMLEAVTLLGPDD